MRWAAEREPAATTFVTVKTQSKRTRAYERAARLRDEARNCLSFAVSEDDTAHAAELIDEALRLARRSRERTDA